MSDTHNFTLEEVLNGKGTKIKNKEYFPTADYVNPFLDRMSKFTDNFRVNVKIPDQITVDASGNVITDDLTFNRVAIEAILPNEYAYDGHVQVIGMVYGLDVRKPIVKFFNAAERCVCTNLCVFSPNMLAIQEIEEATAIDYTPLKHLIDTTNDIKTRLDKMHNNILPCKEDVINEKLGEWIRNAIHMDYKNQYSKVKISNSTVMDSYKLLFEDDESPYFVGNLEEFSMWDAYQSFTDIISHDTKDIMNKFEKILLTSNILGV